MTILYILGYLLIGIVSVIILVEATIFGDAREDDIIVGMFTVLWPLGWMVLFFIILGTAITYVLKELRKR